MARRKNAPESIRVKHGLSERLRVLRTEFYGERGGPDLARTLAIPVRTWYNYENGVTVPAEIILRVIELTSVEPVWLLRGEGSKFRSTGPGPRSNRSESMGDDLAGSTVTDLLRVAIDRLEERERTAMDFALVSPLISRRQEEPSRTGEAWMAHANGDYPSNGPPRSPVDGLKDGTARDEWLKSCQSFRSLRVSDDWMAPIVAHGAQVSYGEPEPISETFHDRLIVAVIDGKPIVRWFQHCGKFALLRAENPAANPTSMLVELDRVDNPWDFHRVLWISTPHP